MTGSGRSRGLFHQEEDPILCEQIIKVCWKVVDRNPMNLKRNEFGFYAPINTCMPFNEETETLTVLQEHFVVGFRSERFSV